MQKSLVFTADELSLRSLRQRVEQRLEEGVHATLRTTWLDTFDWRLFGAGCVLTRERESGRTIYCWRARDRRYPYVLPTDQELRFAHELPAGFLREELEPLVERRALMTVGAARVRRYAARLSDEGGNTVAHLSIEEAAILDRSNRATGESLRTVTVQPVALGQRALDRLLEALRDSGAGGEPESDPMHQAVAARGRRPGDYCSKPRHALQASQRSDEALRTILGHLLETVTANVDGVVADIDIEFLHDLRVATRRARSALAQIRGVLPQSAVDHLNLELRWLGSVTNRCRDLDVYLLEMEGYRRRLGDDAPTLDELERLLRRERARALRRVRSALRSTRFEELVSAWASVVAPASDDPQPVNAARPIAELSGPRILRAYRRMVKRGSRLGDPPPAEELHRLRIDAKKLRYLLEFFTALYPAATIARLVKELKSFQDVLGSFNDMENQRAELTGLADQLLQRGDAGAPTMFAIGRLVDAMRERQDADRRIFRERFAKFSNRSSRRLYSRTFGGD